MLVRLDGLTLTRPVSSDLAEILTLFAHPQVAAGFAGPRGEAATRAALARWIAHWDAHGFGLWVARDPRTGDLVGRGGPQLTINDGDADVEIGWAVHPDRWGRGIGTAIGRAAIDVVATLHGVREVVAKTLPDNGASRRVLEKLGLAVERDIDHHGRHHLLYRGQAGATQPGPAAAPEA